MISEVSAKSMLRKQKQIDSWFLSRYSINLYRGCTHNCVYCDGRDEKYQVEGDFGSDVSIKINSAELLEKELDHARKRKPFGSGYRFVCGGVSDSYQHFEKQYGLTRRTLELLLRFDHPVHMLTKSVLIERDIGLLSEINRNSRALVSFSFSTVDDSLGRKLEPGVPPPSARLETVKRFKDAGFGCGMYLMPVVPFITDSAEMIEQTVSAAKEAGIDFIVFSGMTLKPGRQKDYFLRFVSETFPALLKEYERLYSNNSPWGVPRGEGTYSASRYFYSASSKYRMPRRLPPAFWPPGISPTEQVLLYLEQLDYLAKLAGRNSPYGTAARVLSGAGRPVEQMSDSDLSSFSGVGSYTVSLIREIINTGGCSYYNRLLAD